MRLVCGLLSRGLVRLAILWRLDQGFDGTIGLLADQRLRSLLYADMPAGFISRQTFNMPSNCRPARVERCSAQVEEDSAMAKPMPKIMRVFIAYLRLPYLGLACTLPVRLTSLPRP